jgi:hypothetical protein
MWGGGVQGETNDIEILSERQEVRFLLIIDRVTSPELFSSLYEAFYHSGSLWPIIVPTDLSSSDYHHEFRFHVNGWSGSNVCYGDAYRRGKLIYQKRSSLLMIQPSLSSTELYTMVTSIYQNFTWDHDVYVDYYDTLGYDVTLAFTSPANSENQMWSGWFSWNYDDEGIAERFDLMVWRMDAALISDYDPLTNPDKSDLTAYYEFVFETPRNYNESLAFAVIFFGGTASLITSPFVFLGFIIRRPTKGHTKIAKLPPEEQTTTFWISRIGYFKLIIGSSIVSVLGLFQFIFPSNTSSYLVSILFTSFLWFGLYLLFRSSIERISNASVQFTPIILISTFSIIIGLFGLQYFQLLKTLFINPEMVESTILVTVLFYSTTFGSFMGLMLIYEALYIKSWSYNPVSNVFIIRRQNPWVSMTEYIPDEYIEEVTIDTQAVKSNFGKRNAISLKLQTRPPYKAKEQAWILHDKKSYLNLFSTVTYLTKNKLISVSDSNWIIQALTTSPPLSKEEKLISFGERHPEFTRKYTEEKDLEDELRRKGVIITHEQDKKTTIGFPSYRMIAFRSFILNLSSLLIVSMGMTYTFVRLLDITYRSLTAVGGFIFIGGLIGLLTAFIWAITINYGRRIPITISNHPITLDLSTEGFTIKVRNQTEKYPITLLANVMTRRDLIVGVVLCLSKEFGRLPILYLNDRRLALILASYMSREARQFSRMIIKLAV